MTTQELLDGSDEIAAKISEFDFQMLLDIVADDKKMIELYGNIESNYEKLHLYRIIFEGKDDLIGSDVIRKFLMKHFTLKMTTFTSLIQGNSKRCLTS
ncbi:MAG: hypothetical protein WC742_02785 [Gallionellaceae bacterium]|jgi:hypothetical protein